MLQGVVIPTKGVHISVFDVISKSYPEGKKLATDLFFGLANDVMDMIKFSQLAIHIDSEGINQGARFQVIMDLQNRLKFLVYLDNLAKQYHESSRGDFVLTVR